APRSPAIPGRSLLPAAQQGAHQHRIEVQGLRLLDQPIQLLEVAHRLHPEAILDRLPLRPRVPPPLPLEFQHGALPLTQSRVFGIHGGWHAHKASALRPLGATHPKMVAMTVLPIVIAGDPVLHNPTNKVGEPDLDANGVPTEEFKKFIADMHETMDRAHGVGLAGNQVGVAKRLFVYHCPDIDGPNGEPRSEEEIAAQGGPMRRGTVINPVLDTSEIPETMPDEYDDEEGCLSVPGYSFPTGRADWARVTGIDENGEPVTIEGYGFFARCLQHEVGHLDGFLSTDTLIGRNKRAAKKAFKAEGWNVEGNRTWLPGVDKDPFGHDDVGSAEDED